MKTVKLAQYLDKTAKEYAESKGAADYYYYQEKNVARYQITLEEIRLEFLYSLKGSLREPLSTLSCRVSFDKERPYYFEIQELIDYLDIYDYHCYCFPYIENEKRMSACFEYITDFIEYRYDEIVSLKDKTDELVKRKLNEINSVYSFSKKNMPKDKAGREQFTGNIFNLYSEFLRARYTAEPAYLDFVNGNYEDAIKKYSKMKKTGYEKKLLAFIRERNGAPYQAVPDVCAGIIDVQQYKKTERNSFIITLAISVVGFCFIFFLLQLIVNVTYLGTTRFVVLDLPFKSALFGIVPGLIGGIVFRKHIEPFLRYNKKQALQFYSLLSTSDGTKSPTYIMAAALIISLILFFGTCQPTLAVYNDYFKYDDGDSLFTDYEKYRINEVIKYAVIDGYYKDEYYIEYVEEPVDVLLLAGGGYISLDDMNLTKKDKQELINILYPGMDGYKIRHYYSKEEIL